MNQSFLKLNVEIRYITNFHEKSFMLRTNLTSRSTCVRLRVRFVRSALFFFCPKTGLRLKSIDFSRSPVLFYLFASRNLCRIAAISALVALSWGLIVESVLPFISPAPTAYITAGTAYSEMLSASV